MVGLPFLGPGDPLGAIVPSLAARGAVLGLEVGAGLWWVRDGGQARWVLSWVGPGRLVRGGGVGRVGWLVGMGGLWASLGGAGRGCGGGDSGVEIRKLTL